MELKGSSLSYLKDHNKSSTMFDPTSVSILAKPKDRIFMLLKQRFRQTKTWNFLGKKSEKER